MLNLILHLLATAFRSRRSLILENIALRDQLPLLANHEQGLMVGGLHHRYLREAA